VIFAELKKNLGQKIAPAYIMTGSDVFLINKSVELILGAVGADPNNTVRMEEGTDMNTVNNAWKNVAMFGAKTVVVTRGIDTARVYIDPIKADREAERVDCNPMTHDLVVRMICQNKKFAPAEADYLATICADNYSAVNNETEKLTAYVGNRDRVTRADIDETVTKTDKYQIYELSNAILRRDIARAHAVFDALSNTDIDDYAVFASIASFARRLFYAKTSQKPDGEIAKFLGVNPYAVTATRRDARGITQPAACEFYRGALELEYGIKMGKLSAPRAVVLLLGALK
jgi:DNA polymerase III delta subunit